MKSGIENLNLSGEQQKRIKKYYKSVTHINKMALRIKTKIIISFTSIFTLFFFIGLGGYYSRNIVFQRMSNLEEEIHELEIFSDIQLNMNRLLMPPNDYLITGDLKEKEKFQKLVKKVEKNFKQLDKLPIHEEHIALLRKGEMEKFFFLKEKAEEIFSIPNPVGNKKGAELMIEIDALADDIIINYLDKHYKLEKDEIKDEIAIANMARRKVDMILIIGATVAVITTILLAVHLIRSILMPILAFKQGAYIIGSGNLDYKIDIRDGLEINLLVDEFNKMAQRLKESYTELEKKVEERTRKLNDLNMKLKELAITDGLTEVYNHRHFYEMLQEEIKRAKRYNYSFSLLIADIDYFKHYNDTHGHMEGDKILQGIASSIIKNVREQDIVARYGGEEFSIILPYTDKNNARNLAERIRHYISLQPFPHKETQPNGNLTISIGIATFPQDTNELKDLIKMADRALYRAKETGRNKVEIA